MFDFYKIHLYAGVVGTKYYVSDVYVIYNILIKIHLNLYNLGLGL